MKKTIVFYLAPFALHLAVGAACAPAVATASFPAQGEEPRYGTAPFPNDLFVKNGRVGPIAGLEVLAPAAVDELNAQLGSLSGFGVRPVIELRVTGPLDPTSIPPSTASASDPVFVMNVDPASPAYRTVVPYEWRWDADHGALRGAIARGTVLAERTRYAAVLTERVRGAGGRLVAAPGFAAVKAALPWDVPAQLATTRAALDDLAAQGVGDAVVVSVFTTHDARSALFAARAALEGLPTPTVAFDDPNVIFAGPERLDALLGIPERDAEGRARLGWGQPSGLAHDFVAAVGTGTLSGVTFRREEQEGDAGLLPDAGTWELDAGGVPIVQRDARFPVSFAVPTGEMPPGGWPVAIFQHGLGAGAHQMLAFIETFARAGYVTVAIDADGFSRRHTDVDRKSAVKRNLGEGFLGTHDGPDGFGDVDGPATSFDLFHGFLNIAAMRDQMRQSVIDLSQLVRALRDPALDLSPLVPGARVDGSRVAYLGESYGGVLGATFAAVEPDVSLFVLDVPGGGILDYAAASAPKLRPFVALFLPSTYGADEPLDRYSTLLSLGGTLLDGVDPLAFAPHVLRDRPTIAGRALPPRHLIALEVMNDEVMANGATHALAIAMGLPVLAPSYDDDGRFAVTASPAQANLDGQTAVLIQQSPATHGENWTKETGVRDFGIFGEDDVEHLRLDEPVVINNPVRATHDMLIDVLRDHAAGVAPTVAHPSPPRVDFDDDGMDDASDPEPYRAP